VFANLPEVTSVGWNGPHVVITGTGNVVLAVTALLADRQIVAEELRVGQTSLEDAYLELTSGTSEPTESEPEAN
jgi:ABC-2 type transport system ATP-binding protein